MCQDDTCLSTCLSQFFLKTYRACGRYCVQQLLLVTFAELILIYKLMISAVSGWLQQLMCPYFVALLSGHIESVAYIVHLGWYTKDASSAQFATQGAGLLREAQVLIGISFASIKSIPRLLISVHSVKQVPDSLADKLARYGVGIFRRRLLLA